MNNPGWQIFPGKVKSLYLFLVKRLYLRGGA